MLLLLLERAGGEEEGGGGGVVNIEVKFHCKYLIDPLPPCILNLLLVFCCGLQGEGCYGIFYTLCQSPLQAKRA